MNTEQMIDTVDAFSKKINCGNCNLCEGESVYVMPWEKNEFLKSGAKVIKNEETTYFIHEQRNCQYYDVSKDCKNCKVYKKRPFCCRLYPLGVFYNSGQAEWGVYKHCPNVSEEKLDEYREYAKKLEKNLGPDNCQYLINEDKFGSLIEGLRGEAQFVRGSERYYKLKDVEFS